MATSTTVVEMDFISSKPTYQLTKQQEATHLATTQAELEPWRSSLDRALREVEESPEVEPPETAVDEVEKWNDPRGNIFRTWATFPSFFIIGANDAAVGVGIAPLCRTQRQEVLTPRQALIPYVKRYTEIPIKDTLNYPH